MSAVSLTNWMVYSQLCKPRGISFPVTLTDIYKILFKPHDCSATRGSGARSEMTYWFHFFIFRFSLFLDAVKNSRIRRQILWARRSRYGIVLRFDASCVYTQALLKAHSYKICNCNCSYFGNPRALAALLCDRLRDSEHIVVVSGTVPTSVMFPIWLALTRLLNQTQHVSQSLRRVIIDWSSL